MEVVEAEPRFRKMLSNAGFDIENPNPAIAWELFKEFLRKPVNCSHDGALFQCGVHDWTGKGDRFSLSFVRQFSINADGRYDHMEQLHCQFNCLPSARSRTLKTSLWLEECSTIFGTLFRRIDKLITGQDNFDRYFKAVEALPQFQQGLQHTGWVCEIWQEVV